MKTDGIWTVAVGVDGSEGGTLALAWAMREARDRHGRVRAVTAWQWSATEAALLAATTPDQIRQWSQALLDDALTHARREFPGVPLTGQVIEGNPADILIEAAAAADQLVVGSHGHGRLYHALLGSVAKRCIRRATCAVTIVPTTRRALVTHGTSSDRSIADPHGDLR